MQNPILSAPDHVVKDQAVVSSAGRWHAVFSYEDHDGVWRIGLRSSSDLWHWSKTTVMPHDANIAGEASPDVERAPNGQFVVAYQSFTTDRDGARPKLYYRTTHDFIRFSPPRRLAANLFPEAGERLIDPALVWSPAGLLLGFKRGVDQQQFELARSERGSLDGPWKLLGVPSIAIRGDTIENYQFLHLDGRWKLLATTNNGDQPAIFDLVGDPKVPVGWLHWSAGRMLDIPKEPWNPGSGLTGTTYEHANCSYLVDRKRVDGWYYLTYSDAPDKTPFSGEGHAVVAIARSRDLIHWTVPAQRRRSGVRRVSPADVRSPAVQPCGRGCRASRAGHLPR